MKKFIFIALIVGLCACSKGNDLGQSIWVYDPNNTDLPAYSEWGYNTFGAYYDRAPFVSNTQTPATILISNDTLIFNLKGVLLSGGVQDMTLTFRIVKPDWNINTYPDLVSLNQTNFDLTQPNCQVSFRSQSGEDTLKLTSGNLQFKRAQHLFVDGQSVETILSGVFAFSSTQNSDILPVTDGRFDVGIGTQNFASQ
ncbi:MAG: hypothetical protein LBE82_06110 [Chitinophagaceae bacterium]|jgi:hypothetical protein|nr:hypothetical protein [Chitinophagaceae bacterium]